MVFPVRMDGLVVPVAVSPRNAPPTMGSDTFVYTLSHSQPLPTVDLSHTLCKLLLPPSFFKTIVRFLAQHYHHLLLGYPFGVACFLLSFFLSRSTFRSLLVLTALPTTLILLASASFLSIDVLRLLLSNYEFWFLTIINFINWGVLGLVLDDARMIMCTAAWFANQSIIMIDANYRTYPTAMSLTIFTSPIVIAIGAFMATHSIQDAYYFDVIIGNRTMFCATDVIDFTTSTLVLFLVKLADLKKTRIHRTFRGFKNIPCVVTKAVLQLTPPHSDGGDSTQRRRRRPGVTMSTKQLHGHLHQQQFILSGLPKGEIDEFRTLLLYHVWRVAPSWCLRNSSKLRALFYVSGSLALALLSIQSLENVYVQWQISESINAAANTSGAGLPVLTQAALRGPFEGVIAGVHFTLTVCFCGSFVPFYQRDVMWLLLFDFDVAFSFVQMFAFVVCLCDLQEWDLIRSVTMATWGIWYTWALTLDALTPVIKSRIFCFQKRWAAPVVTTIILGATTTGLLIVLIPNIGLRDRVILDYGVSRTVRLSLTTQTVLLGRVVTIVLWCSRQAYLLVTRADNEFNLIRASVEYASPFATFPLARNGSTAVVALMDDGQVSNTVVPVTPFLRSQFATSIKPSHLHPQNRSGPSYCTSGTV